MFQNQHLAPRFQESPRLSNTSKLNGLVRLTKALRLKPWSIESKHDEAKQDARVDRTRDVRREIKAMKQAMSETNGADEANQVD